MITLPVSHPNFPEKGQGIVRGYYASVELVKELDVTLTGYQMGTIEGGERKIRGVEWRMVTSSDPGGRSTVVVSHIRVTLAYTSPGDRQRAPIPNKQVASRQDRRGESRLIVLSSATITAC